MIQRQRLHQPGAFAPCKGCGKQPKHYEVHGTSTRDPCGVRAADGAGHMIECHPCSARTPVCESLDGAVAAWVMGGLAAPADSASKHAFHHHLRAIK